MTVSLSLTEAQILAALRGFLIGVLPTGIEVFRAEINRVPEPIGQNFVVMTPLMRSRLSTNIDSTLPPAAGQTVGSASSLARTQVVVQLDIHGPVSADNVQIVTTMMRDDFACQAFAASGFDVQPLYAEEPRQSVFENAEQQSEMRWTVDLVLQANPVVTVPLQSALSVTVGIVEIDAAYPPGASP